MSQALDQQSRTMIFSFGMGDSAEVIRLATTAASGALGVKLFDWIRRGRAKSKQQAGEWQVRVFDDGAKIREEERAESKALRIESRENLDRAHKAEIEGVSLRNENTILRSRLARKDEQLKALTKQIIELQKVPVTFEPNWELESQHGGNGRNTYASPSIDPGGNEPGGG